MFDHRIILFDAFILVCISIRLSVLGEAVVDYKCDTGLASFDDVTKGLANTLVLHDGESGWISGYADLSTFLAFEGCSNMSMIKVKRSEKFSGPKINILNNCVHHCSNTEYKYFGVSGDTCYCFENQDRESLADKMDMESSLSCLASCDTIFSSSCDRFVLVYKYLHNHVKQNILRDLHGAGQCIAANFFDGYANYITRSCYNSVSPVRYNICENMDKCNEGRNNYSDSCTFDSPNSSMMGSLVQCFKHGGFLKSFDYILINILYTVKPAIYGYYWMNGFRVINPVEQKRNSCLAITKRNSTFLLDSDDCRHSRVPICKLKSVEQYMITSQDQVTSIHIPLLVGSSVGSVLIIVSVIVSIVIYRRRRQARSDNSFLPDTHSVDTPSPNTNHGLNTNDVQNGNTEPSQCRVSDSENHIYDLINEEPVNTISDHISPCTSIQQLIMDSSDNKCAQFVNQRSGKQGSDLITKAPFLEDKMDKLHEHYRDENTEQTSPHTSVEEKRSGDYPYIDLLDDQAFTDMSLEADGPDYPKTIHADDTDYLHVIGDAENGRAFPHNVQTQAGYIDMRGHGPQGEQKYTTLDAAQDPAKSIHIDDIDIEYGYVDMDGNE